MDMRGVVGRDGDGLDAIFAAADHTNRLIKMRAEEIVPLAYEIEGRRDDERGAAIMIDRHQRELAFAGAGREDDEAAPARFYKSRERLFLIGPRRAVDLKAGAELEVAPGAIVVFDAAATDLDDQSGVIERFCAMSADARVVSENAGEELLFLCETAEDEAPLIEFDLDHRAEANAESAAGHPRGA